MSPTNRTVQNEGAVIDAGTGGRDEIAGTAELNNVGLFDIRDNLARDNVINPVRSPTFKKFRDAAKECWRMDLAFNDTVFNNTGTMEVLIGRVLINEVTSRVAKA